MTEITTQAYWVIEPGRGELRTESVSAEGAPDTCLIRAIHGAVSLGTERLVGLGKVPASCQSDMACQYMAGHFSLPIKYGYHLVGRIEEGEHSGKHGFVMHPHQGVARVRERDVVILPESLPRIRATLIPNLETALNAVWDAEVEGQEPSTPLVIWGAGIVGLLVAYVLERQGFESVEVVEATAPRRDFANSLPWIGTVREPREVSSGRYGKAFHCTGSPAALQGALDSVGFEGTVIEMSWFGDQTVPLRLGTDFHSQRKQIRASQVGTVAPSRRGSHGPRERLDVVLELLDDADLDLLLGSPLNFPDLPNWMSQLYANEASFPAPIIEYGE